MFKAHQDAYLPRHPQITEVPNLHVMMTVKSLKSRDYLEEVFCWQWGYYFITNKGVKYLAKELGKISCSLNMFLGLPDDIVPATFKKKRAAAVTKVKGEDQEEGNLI